MPFAEIDDLDMYYEERGEGPCLLMIMGFTANVDWWPENFLSPLSRHFRLILIDNRGAGRTKGDVSRFSISRSAGEAYALLNYLDIHRTHVLGISMGGMIAQELALQHPEMIDRLVLAATFAGGFSGKLRLFRAEQMVLLWHLLTRRRDRHQPAIMHLLFARDYLAKDKLVVRNFKRKAGKAPCSRLAMRHQFWSMAAFDTRRRLKQISAPTLVIAGTRDNMMPAACSRQLARKIPNARLELLKGRGHAFLAEAPVESAQLMTEFLCDARTN